MQLITRGSLGQARRPSVAPFFQAFGPLLFRSQAALAGSARRWRKSRGAAASASFMNSWANFPPDGLLSRSAEGARRRDRVFTPKVAFGAFVSQVLAVGSACRDAGMPGCRAQGGGMGALDAEGSPGRAPPLRPSASCQARARLDRQTLRLIPGHLSWSLERRVARAQLWLGRQGQERRWPDPFPALSRPDPPGNQPSWPQPSTQKEGLGFPCLKLTGIFSLASGGLEDYATGTLHQPESILLRSLWGRLEKGGLLLGDRGFCSSAALGARSRRGIDAVLRLHQARKVGFREGRRLGGADRLVGLEEAGATPRGVAWAGVGGSARKPFGETEPAPGRPARLAPAGGLPW